MGASAAMGRKGWRQGWGSWGGSQLPPSPLTSPVVSSCCSLPDLPETIELEVRTTSPSGLILWQGVVSGCQWGEGDTSLWRK